MKQIHDHTCRRHITIAEDKAIRKWFRAHRKDLKALNSYTNSYRFYNNAADCPRRMSYGHVRKYMIVMKISITGAGPQARYASMTHQFKGMQKRLSKLEALLGESSLTF